MGPSNSSSIKATSNAYCNEEFSIKARTPLKPIKNVRKYAQVVAKFVNFVLRASSDDEHTGAWFRSFK